MGGLIEHSWDEIQRIFAGKTVGVSFSVGSDAFVLSGTTNQADLLQQLELLRAYIVAPGYREESIVQARKKFRSPLSTARSDAAWGRGERSREFSGGRRLSIWVSE